MTGPALCRVGAELHQNYIGAGALSRCRWEGQGGGSLPWVTRNELGSKRIMTTTETPAPDRALEGIGWMLLTTVLFVFVTGIVRYLGSDISAA